MNQVKQKNQELDAQKVAVEQSDERALRPQTLDDFIGQQPLRENLRIFINAAKSRGDSMDHVLFFGPPGLGKTTLAQIVARELGVGFRATSGPVIAKSGDLAAILTNLQPNDVLFIDEIVQHAAHAGEHEKVARYCAREIFQQLFTRHGRITESGRRIVAQGHAAETAQVFFKLFIGGRLFEQRVVLIDQGLHITVCSHQ